MNPPPRDVVWSVGGVSCQWSQSHLLPFLSLTVPGKGGEERTWITSLVPGRASMLVQPQPMWKTREENLDTVEPLCCSHLPIEATQQIYQKCVMVLCNTATSCITLTRFIEVLL